MICFGSYEIKRLLFIGNSLSNNIAGTTPYGYRFPTTTYNLVAALGRKYSLNTYAVGGLQGQQMISQWSTITSQHPITIGDVVVVWEGINDMGAGGLNGTQAYNNLATLCSNVRATGAKVVLLDVIPANMTGTYPSWETNRGTCNGLIASNASSICDVWVNLTSNAAFNAANDYSDTTYYHTDTIHLNNTGYDLVATLTYNAMATIL